MLACILFNIHVYDQDKGSDLLIIAILSVLIVNL